MTEDCEGGAHRPAGVRPCDAGGKRKQRERRVSTPTHAARRGACRKRAVPASHHRRRSAGVRGPQLNSIPEVSSSHGLAPPNKNGGAMLPGVDGFEHDALLAVAPRLQVLALLSQQLP